MGAIRTILRHTFGLRTIAPIGVSGFSGYLTLSGMRMSIDDPDFWLVFLAGLTLGLISWGAIARESWLQKKRRAVDDLRIDGLVKSMEALSPPAPVSVQNLSGLTTANQGGATFTKQHTSDRGGSDRLVQERLIFEWLMETFGFRVDDAYQPLSLETAHLYACDLAARLDLPKSADSGRG